VGGERRGEERVNRRGYQALVRFGVSKYNLVHFFEAVFIPSDQEGDTLNTLL